MPRKRFESLPEDKRRRILDAAAAEIQEHGVVEASINRILQAAELSKGVAYYYFENRDDLLATVLSEKLKGAFEQASFSPEELTGETYWPRLYEFCSSITDPVIWDPWVLTVARELASLPFAQRTTGALGELYGSLTNAVAGVVHRGSELGLLIDLPESLLVRMLLGVGDAVDGWFLEHLDTVPLEELSHLNDRIFLAMRRMVERSPGETP